MRRTTIMLAAASATLLLFSACGSSSKGASATTAKPADTTSAAPDTTAPDTTPVSDTVPPLIATGPHKDELVCTVLLSFSDDKSPFNFAQPTPDDFKSFYSTVVTPGVATLRAVQSEEIKAASALVADAFEQIGTVLAANAWDANVAQNDPGLSTLLNGNEFTNASTLLGQYCGFGT